MTGKRRRNSSGARPASIWKNWITTPTSPFILSHGGDPCPPQPPNPFSGGALAAAAQQGPQTLAAELLKYGQVLVRNTDAMKLLARLAESGFGQTQAARAYAQAQGFDAARYRAQAAEASAARVHLETPGGTAAQLESLRQAAAADSAQSALRVRQAEAQARHQQTPEFRAATEARAGADSADALNQLRARAEYARAQAAQAATPQGRSEARERVGLSRSIEASELRQAQAENVAAYGKLGGGALNAYQGLQRMAAAAGPYTAAAAAAVAAYSFAAAASPSAAKTFGSSMELLSAKIGHVFVPGLNDLSQAAQNAGHAWDQFARTDIGGKSLGDRASDFFASYIRGSMIAASAAAASGNRPMIGAATDYLQALVAGGLPSAISGAINGKTLGQNVSEWAGIKDRGGMSTDLDLPLRARSFSGPQGFDQFGIGLQQASLQSGANQTSMELLREQIVELRRSNALLTQLAGNSNAAAQAVPSFG